MVLKKMEFTERKRPQEMRDIVYEAEVKSRTAATVVVGSQFQLPELKILELLQIVKEEMEIKCIHMGVLTFPLDEIGAVTMNVLPVKYLNEDSTCNKFGSKYEKYTCQYLYVIAE